MENALSSKSSHAHLFNPCSIYCATWNVNNKTCSDSNNPLRAWLACSEKPPDIYAIGLQELDTPTKAMLNSTQVQAIEKQWM